jgi:voltage-gated potassium channel
MPIFITITRRLSVLVRNRVLALVAVAVVVILAGAGLFAATQGYDYWTGLYWAITTATTVGYGDVLAKNGLGRVIASVVMLTTIPIVGAIFSLVVGASAATHIRRMLGMETRLPDEPYTVIYGLDPVVPRVLEELCAQEATVVLVAPVRPAAAPRDLVFIAGDPTDERVVKSSNPTQADRALIACEDESDTMVVAVTLHALAPELKTYALTQSPRVSRALRELGVAHTLAADELVAHTVAKSLETPEAGDLLLGLVDSTDYRMAERIVDDALATQTLSAARAASIPPAPLILGIARDGNVDLGIGDDPQLSVGDRLIVLQQS